MCHIFTLSVYRLRSLGELGACCSQRQLDRKCKPLCWRVYFCSDKNCSYKGPLYSARGPQRGGAESAPSEPLALWAPVCHQWVPMSPGPPATTSPLRALGWFTPGHAAHSEPSLTPSVLQKSLRRYNKRNPVSPSHSCALGHLFQWACGGRVCDAREAARSLRSHPSPLLPVPHVSLTLLRRKRQLPGMQGQL